MNVRRARVVISIFDDIDNPHYAGGGPAVVARLARALLEQHNVLVITAGRGLARTYRDGVEYLQLPVAWAGPRLGQVLWALLLPVAVLVVRHDLWVESFTPPFSSNFVPLLTRRPVIGLAQALSGREMQRRYRTTVPLRVERAMLARYRDVVVLNPEDRRIVRSCVPRAAVHLIPNVVDPPQRPVTDPGDCFALFIGRVDVTQKGLDLLLRSYRSPDADLPPLVLAGAGRDGEETALRRILDGCGGDVRWLGPVQGEEKEDLLQRCAFVVTPSREESFSLVALEALVRGRPVVRFDLPQTRWIPGGCGTAVPCFDPDALRTALVTMWADREGRVVAGRRAAAAGAELVGPRAMEPYRRLVDELLRSGAGVTSAVRRC